MNGVATDKFDDILADGVATDWEEADGQAVELLENTILGVNSAAFLKNFFLILLTEFG